MIISYSGVILEWLNLHSAVMLIAAGIIIILVSWWEWCHSDPIRPGSYRYRLYESNYLVTHWVRRKTFSKIASRYVKRVAKRGFVMGIFAILVGTVLFIIQAL
jgi:hypothetical protein